MSSRCLARARASLLVGCLGLTFAQSAAAAPDASKRLEARERFDRGLVLFNQGDNQGALAEFQRAYQLTGNATVLYNIARVQAAAGDPVEALETLERLLAAPVDLPGARMAQLQALKQDQEQRVGFLSVRSSVAPGARVEVDGIDAGAIDPGKPLRLAAGRHVVGVLVPGYYPLRKTLWLAGKEQKTVEFALEPLEGTLGHVKLHVEPMDVTVTLDDQELGKTPHLVELALAPGKHRLSLARPGFRDVAREIVVPEAGALEVTETLTFDPASRAGHEGWLSVKPSEAEAVVFVNGAVENAALKGMSLPEGQHRLRVERAGFLPSERTISVPRASNATIQVTLEPTADYRADYVASASSRRSWALGIGIGGAVVAAASTGYLLINGKQVTTAESDFNDALSQAKMACSPAATKDCDTLKARAAIREDDLGSKRDRQVFGWVGLGVGAAALGAGVALWLTGADPHRYDPQADSDVFGSLDLLPWLGPNGGGLSIGKQL
ncbi:MAG TPA: PEGA domain-containing protein [Polyangiaceae bacterium]|nr:PEGA domain-containing protein [Polyangiaceae bacterium]